MRVARLVAVLALACMAPVLARTASAGAPFTTGLVSAGLNGEPAVRGAGASNPSLSANGRYVAFLSLAQNFAPAPLFRTEVYVKDLLSGEVDLASQSTDGVAANGRCYEPVVSGDGRWVLFSSEATNLVSAASRHAHAFLRDRVSRTTIGITPEPDPAYDVYAEAMSPDARFIAVGVEGQIQLLDRDTGTWELLTLGIDGQPADGWCSHPAITPDGRFVVFDSGAHNLTAGPPRDRYDDREEVYLRDRQTGVLEKVSQLPDSDTATYGNVFPSISDDGRLVAFTYGYGYEDGGGEDSTVQVRNRADGSLRVFDAAALGLPEHTPVFRGTLSGDGRSLACYAGWGTPYEGPDRAREDAYVIDLQSGRAEQVSVPTGGGATRPAMPFTETEFVDGPVLSTDGRLVVFSSALRGLVPGDENGKRDVFLHDRAAGTTSRVNVTREGGEAVIPADSYAAGISGDGRYVLFISDAQNLVPGGGGGAFQVYVADRTTGAIELASVSTSGERADGVSRTAAMSADGRFVAFLSYAQNLTPGDVEPPGGYLYQHVYLRDRLLRTTRRLDPPYQKSAHSDGPFGSWDVLITPDGQNVVFTSNYEGAYDGLRAVVVWDARTGRTEIIGAGKNGIPPSGVAIEPAISANGRFVAWSHRFSTVNDEGFNVLLHDRLRHTTERVDRTLPGNPVASMEPSLSADGQTLLFAGGYYDYSYNSFVETGLYMRERGALRKLTLPDESYDPELQPDGRYIVYDRDQVYRYDRVTGATETISAAPPGIEEPWSAGGAYLTPNGQHAAFTHVSASDHEWTAAEDVYARDLPPRGGLVRAPDRVDFGTVPLNTPARQALTVTNASSTEALEIHADALTGIFSLVQGKGYHTLLPGQSATLQVEFHPVRPARQTAVLRLRTTDPAHPVVPVILEGRGSA